MKEKQVIRDFYNVIQGYIETDTISGNKTIYDYHGRVLGHYDKKQNVTRNFYNQVIAKGDISSSLIMRDK